MSFVARQLGFAYGLHDASFEFPQNGLITIAGPNGAGKSTLLGILAGLRSPYQRIVHVCGQGNPPVAQARVRAESGVPAAKRPDGISVHRGRSGADGADPLRAADGSRPTKTASAAEEAMTTTDTLAFRARDFRTLSGGEAQRVILASALTQRPEALLLDEPATHLDLRHQLSLYRLLGELAKSLLVVAVTHDLNLALQFSRSRDGARGRAHRGRWRAAGGAESGTDRARVRSAGYGAWRSG